MELNIEKIKQELKRRDWSMEDFAIALGAKRTFPYALLGNSKSHTLKTVSRIAKALDFDPKDLII